MAEETLRCDVAIVGGGLAGLVTALELLERGKRVTISWQVMNWRIAKKELAVSGSEFNDAIREKRRVAFLKTALFGNEALVRTLVERCPDFVVADSLEELVERMNALSGEDAVRPGTLRETISTYDAVIDCGEPLHNDEQLRRIAHLRRYRGDRVRTRRFQKIIDPRAMPLVAVREFVLSRKSLGGIQTDLSGALRPGGRRGGRSRSPGCTRSGRRRGSGAVARTACGRWRGPSSAPAC